MGIKPIHNSLQEVPSSFLVLTLLKDFRTEGATGLIKHAQLLCETADFITPALIKNKSNSPK